MFAVDITFHYPPEIMNLLIEIIPLINKSKTQVLIFFQGAGVSKTFWGDLEKQLSTNRDSLKKWDITRTILVRLNEKGVNALRQRREVLKRIVEFEDFSACWPNDQLKAKGLIAEVRRVVNIKDSFTRMNLEREKERQKHQDEYRAKLMAEKEKLEQRQQLKNDLFALFSEKDTHKRGKDLESILNRLFESYGILVKEAFTLVGDHGEGIIEQIDGAIMFDGHLYLVEMKWWKEPLGPGEISQHLLRIYNRADARGIFISASDYTEAAIANCVQALQQKVVFLCKLREIVFLLENQGDLSNILRYKVNAAIIERKPFVEL